MTSEKHALSLDAGLREDALDALRDALHWKLTARGWAGVAEVVAALDAAVQVGDADAVQARVCELETRGPVRATGIDEDPKVCAPETVRPVLNALVRALEEDEEPEPPHGDG